jgi:hypothetical protein
VNLIKLQTRWKGWRGWGLCLLPRAVTVGRLSSSKSGLSNSSTYIQSRKLRKLKKRHTSSWNFQYLTFIPWRLRQENHRNVVTHVPNYKASHSRRWNSLVTIAVKALTLIEFNVPRNVRYRPSVISVQLINSLKRQQLHIHTKHWSNFISEVILTLGWNQLRQCVGLLRELATIFWQFKPFSMSSQPFQGAHSYFQTHNHFQAHNHFKELTTSSQLFSNS